MFEPPIFSHPTPLQYSVARMTEAAKDVAKLEKEIALAKKAGASTNELVDKLAEKDKSLEGALTSYVVLSNPDLKNNPDRDAIIQRKVAAQKEISLATARYEVERDGMKKTARMLKRSSRDDSEGSPRQGFLDRFRRKPPEQKDPKEDGKSR